MAADAIPLDKGMKAASETVSDHIAEQAIPVNTQASITQVTSFSARFRKLVTSIQQARKLSSLRRHTMNAEKLKEFNPMGEILEFLMIEDNPGDIRLNQEYLKEYKIPVHLSVVNDDVEALRFLHHQGEYILAIHPDIILISIRVLWWDNASLVKQIKCDVTLAQIPIVLLTAFEGEEDIFGNTLPITLSATKPLDWKRVIDLLEHPDDFSLTRDTLKKGPQGNRTGLLLNDLNPILINLYRQNRQGQLWREESKIRNREYASV